ncbi:MAG TPA: CoA transferase, partial [Caulobacteraceae bacterium]|nr:CoA transferase [Caulobacteraceae bacterium]
MSAFRGLRVLDFSQGLAGPMAGMLLADFGAQVLKVEGPDGDRMGHHPGHLMWNRGKARVGLDIAAPKDRTRIHALIAGADVAIFDAGPGVLEPLGLDGASLTAQHPRLVHVWTPPYGTS